jgi:hypothetical protein
MGDTYSGGTDFKPGKSLRQLMLDAMEEYAAQQLQPPGTSDAGKLRAVRLRAFIETQIERMLN